METGLQLRLKESPIFLYIPESANKYFYHPQLQIKEFKLTTVQSICDTLKEYSIWDQILAFLIFCNELDLITELEVLSIFSLYEPTSPRNTVWTHFLIALKDGFEFCGITYPDLRDIYFNSHLNSIPIVDWNRIIANILARTTEIINGHRLTKFTIQ